MAALSFAEFESEVRRAEDEVSHGQWHSAVARYGDVFRRRLEDLQFRPDALTDTDLLVLERLADIAVPIGQMETADLLYGVACNIYRRGHPDRFTLAAIKRVHIALAADRFDNALRLMRETESTLGPVADVECTDQGLARWERRRPWNPQSATALEAQIYLVSGRVLTCAGQFDHGCTLLRRGLVYADTDRDVMARQVRAPLRLALAAALLAQGEIRRAETILSRVAAEIVRPTDLIRARELDASVAIMRGELGRAIDALSTAIETCRGHGLTRGLASELVSRAKVFLVLNLTSEAARDLDEARAISADMRSDGLHDRIARLQQYSHLRQRTLFGGVPLADPVAFLQSGTPRPDGAASADEHAVASWRPADFIAFYEEREIELMTVVQAHAPASRIEALLRFLHQDFEHTDSRYVRARLTLVRGVCDVHRADWRSALVSCDETAATFEALGLPAEELVARRFQGLCIEQIPSRHADLAACRRRAETLLTSLTTGMSSALREAFLVNKWSQRDGEVADATKRLLNDRDRFTSLRGPLRWLACLLWTIRVFAFHRSLTDRAAGSPSPSVSATAHFAALWGLVRHPWREQTLNFTVLANGVLLLSIRWCHCDLHWTTPTRARVRALVTHFHERLASGDPEHEVVKAASELATEIGFIDAVSDAPARIRRLRIYPDDQLNGFPFAVVPLGGEGQVVDRWAVTTGIRRAVAPGRTPRPQRAVIATASGGATRPRLVEARRQVDWLSMWWRNRGVEAVAVAAGTFDADALSDALASSQIVHFSGHGVFDPDMPDRTGIVVDGGNGGEAIVSVKELAALDCRRLMFATFLACWSADSFLFPGRWTVSIPSTLCAAGAGTVVAPLWEVEDAISTELLTALYARLPHDRVDEALRRAQVVVRSGSKGQRRASFLWAAVQVYGDGGRLPLG